MESRVKKPKIYLETKLKMFEDVAETSVNKYVRVSK